MPTLLERLAKLKGVVAPATVPTPPPAPAPAPAAAPVAAAPPKPAEYASAMPDMKKTLTGKVTVVEDETGFTFIAPYADEIEWDKVHKQFGSEHKGWILNTSKRVVEGKGERIAVYLRPEPILVAAATVALPAGKPKTLSERLRAKAGVAPAVPAPAAAAPAPAPAKAAVSRVPIAMKIAGGAVEQMRAKLQAMSPEGLKAMYEASKTLPMAMAEKALLMEEAVRRGIAKPGEVEEAPAPEPEKPKIVHVTPEEMDEMRKRLKTMSDEVFKQFFDEAGKVGLREWERMILLEEAERRNIFKEAPAKAVEVKPAEPAGYTQFMEEGKKEPSKKKFITFIEEWGLKLQDVEDVEKQKVVEEHKKIAQGVWEQFIKDKKLPAWDELSTEAKQTINRNYMGRLREKYGETLEVERVRRGFKSVDELVGDIWKRYGRRWAKVPPEELGLGRHYPGGVSGQEWHQKFLGFVMRSPYMARPQRAQELYSKYGIFGKMPPITEFKFPEEISAAVAKGEEPSDADAVVRFYNESNRPLTDMDFAVLFADDPTRVERAKRTMDDYTEDHFKNEVYRILDEMVKTPAGKERLKFIALTDSKKILADMVHDIDSKFRSTEPAFSDLAYESLLEYLPKMMPTMEERAEVLDVQTAQNYNEKRRTLVSDLERIRPSWDNIQVMGQQKEILQKWDVLYKELGRPISAIDYYMRYPGTTKEAARTLETYKKFDDIKKLWEGKIPSKENIEAMVPALVKRISEYKPAGVKVEGDKNKAELEKDVLLLDRLNDLYMYQTEKSIVEKLDVGNVLRAASLVDAREFSQNVYKPEWLGEAEFTRIAAVIKEKRRIPTEEDLFAEFKDAGIVRAVLALFAEGKVPSKIKLSDDTIQEIATFKGLDAGAVAQALAAFKGSGEFPKSMVEIKKLEGVKERQEAVRRFIRIAGRAVPKAFKGRIDEIRAIGGSNRIRLDKYNALITELEAGVGASNVKVAGLEKQKGAVLQKGTKQMQEAVEAELMEAMEEQDNLLAALRAARHDRLALLKTLPKADYTKGQVEIDHKLYVNRKAVVKGTEVPVTLADVYKYWVEPVEVEQKEFVSKNKAEPTSFELVTMEPSVDKILAEEKAGKPIPDKEKKVAVIALMNYAREIGAYQFEYEMAQMAKELNVKDVPLFALPAASPETRAAQFAEWLKFGLTRKEIEEWEPHVQLAFIGDDWKECSWDGEPKKLEDVSGQKAHLRECAIFKAKAAQSAAIQFLKPEDLQPIIVEAGEAPPSAELERLLAENAKLKKDLATKTGELVESHKLGKETLKKLLEVSELEAGIATTEERVKGPAVVASTAPAEEGGKRRLIIRRRTASPQEVEGLKKRKDAVQQELEAAVGKEKVTAVTKETAKQIEELKELSKKIEQERSKSREICFFQEEWSSVKAAIGEHMASNASQLSDLQSKLTAARASGLSGASVYESAVATLKDEGQILDELVTYIRDAEKGAPDKFICTPSEEKTIRG